ncbi:MAG: hypothetical protein ACYDA4_11810 [Ignavibacteriaceae bacterium]
MKASVPPGGGKSGDGCTTLRYQTLAYRFPCVGKWRNWLARA